MLRSTDRWAFSAGLPQRSRAPSPSCGYGSRIHDQNGHSEQPAGSTARILALPARSDNVVPIAPSGELSGGLGARPGGLTAHRRRAHLPQSRGV